MVNKEELDRLNEGERLIRKIMEADGLLTTDIDFQVVPPQKMFELRAYQFPVNFSHWSFGRDYDRVATIYRHSLSGIPYEQVFNFRKPEAFITDTSPFALKLGTIAHVFYHVDFFLANRFLQHSRSITDVAREARMAAERFRKYEELYGPAIVEQLIDAGMSLQWHQHPDPFYQEPDEENVRTSLIDQEMARLKEVIADDGLDEKEKESLKKSIRENIGQLERKTPPIPVYDLLHYIIHNSPRPLYPWMKDVLEVIRNQARVLAPNVRTKMLNEGWATYGHMKLMNRLLEEKFITPKEHAIFLDYHSWIARRQKIGFNWYSIGYNLYKYVREAWDKGRFGREYDECESEAERADWDKKLGLGEKKILEVRTNYSDRMAVEELFTDDFIHREELYIYQAIPSGDGSQMSYVVVERDPKTIRELLKRSLFFYNEPIITVQNGSVKGRSLILKHHYQGQELDGQYAQATLRNIFHLWGRPIYLETLINGKKVMYICEGSKVVISKV